MRIAVFHNLPVGGAKRVMSQQIAGLSKNHKIDIYTYENQKKLPRFNPVNYCNKVYYYQFSVKNQNRLLNDFGIFYRLKKLNKKIAAEIDKRNYDVVLVHADEYMEAPYILRYLRTKSIHYDQEILGICYLKQFRFKKQVGIHKKAYEFFYRKFLMLQDKKNIKNADKVIAVSKYLQSFLVENYDLKAEYCYPGIDHDVFKKSRVKKKNKDFLYVGNRGEYEDYKMVKKAFELAKEKVSDINIFYLSKRKIEDDKKLARVYSSATAVICAYFAETFGLKAVEPMSCGTAVIAPNYAVYPEIIKNGKNGFLVTSAEQMSKRILELAKDRRKAAEMGQTARHMALNFTLEKHTNCIQKGINDLLKVSSK